jgi:hypothetical protein
MRSIKHSFKNSECFDINALHASISPSSPLFLMNLGSFHNLQSSSIDSFYFDKVSLCQALNTEVSLTNCLEITLVFIVLETKIVK